MTAPALADAHSLPTVRVLASGWGARYLASGGTTHKLQAALGGKTVLERTLDAVRASGLPWHLEDAGHPGMSDSIAAAVRACLRRSARFVARRCGCLRIGESLANHDPCSGRPGLYAGH